MRSDILKARICLAAATAFATAFFIACITMTF